MMAKGPSLLCLTVSRQSSLFLMYALTNFICCSFGAGRAIFRVLSDTVLFLERAAAADGVLAADALLFPLINTGRPELAACGDTMIKATLQRKTGTCDFNIVLN